MIETLKYTLAMGYLYVNIAGAYFGLIWIALMFLGIALGGLVTAFDRLKR